MENASKALIIAGAILLAILLISLGILIFNQAKDTIGNSGMSQAEISAFNQKFTKYEGAQKGSIIRAMMQDVIANNNSSSSSEEILVGVNVAPTIHGQKRGTDHAINSPCHLDPAVGSPVYRGTNPVFNANMTYQVSFEYYQGRICQIVVTD